jgi:hypothetical protein
MVKLPYKLIAMGSCFGTCLHCERMPIQQSQSSDNQDLLHAIRIEAKFFGFPELATACAADDGFMPLRNYKIVRGLINQAQDEEDGGMCVNCPSGSTTYLLMALGSMWAPFSRKRPD